MAFDDCKNIEILETSNKKKIKLQVNIFNLNNI